MRRLACFSAALASLAGLAACSNTAGVTPPTTVDCSTAALTNLPVGEHTIIDASTTGCVRLAAAGPSGADYLYVALATEGKETDTGVSVTYQLTGTGG